MFLGEGSFAAQLATRASSRLLDAFRPATQGAYARMFLGFLVAAGLFIHQVTTVTLLIFMEFLLDQGLSPSNIVNHMVAIRSQFILHGLDTSPLENLEFIFSKKSLKYTRPFCPKLTQIITIDMLSQILSVSETLQYPIVFKALYSFCFVFPFYVYQIFFLTKWLLLR